uniref:Lipase domain-containing protein n=1 Tax=Photinus pyralis TaxID=7054 RepID=A0A1Y1L7L7_PHOPY
MPSELLLILLLVAGAHSLEPKVEELPAETLKELVLIHSNKQVAENCTNHKPGTIPQFLLFNRDHRERPIVLSSSNLDQVLPEKETIVLIPGWLISHDTQFFKEMRDAYLERYDCNLIIVDWSKIALLPYTYIHCEVPSIGLRAAKFLCQLSRTVELELNQMHVVGYSFGAQIAGYLGRYVRLQCDQEIGRITALDAAGPLYESAAANKSLTKTDALFVDVIHTTSSFGMWKNCGKVDFHPNCEVRPQPGCRDPSPTVGSAPVADTLCSSLRSVEYMTESIQSTQLIAISCGLCSRYCHPDIISEVYTIMGEECKTIPKPAKNFLIRTRDKRPYGQGMLPYQ